MRQFISCIMLLCVLCASAQGMKVKDFRLLESDLTANTAGTKRISPQDGNTAALIKVVTTESDFNFDGGNYALVGNPEYKPGEIWIYVPARAQKLSISHNRFGVIRDYFYPVPIDAGRTYELVLDPGVGRYVTLQTSTPRSVIYLDGDSIGISPIYNQYILYGRHTLKSENARMLGETTIDVINDGSEDALSATITMVDQSPNYGTVVLKTDKDAEILIDGVIKGVGTWTGELYKGDYVVETRKVNCDPAKTTITVSPQQKKEIEVDSPIPFKGYLQLFTRPQNPDITINGKSHPFSPHMELPVGIAVVNFSRKGYHSREVEFDIRHNVTVTDTVNLERIQYLKDNGFYFGGAYTAGVHSGATGIIGLTYRKINLQLGYTFGLSETKPVNNNKDNQFLSRTKYKVNSLSVKAGYQFALATHFGIIPQIGYTVQVLNGSIIEGSVDPNDGALCNNVSVGAMLIYSPIQHFCLFAAPEYDVAVMKDQKFDNVSKAAGASLGGFYCSIGLLMNF